MADEVTLSTEEYWSFEIDNTQIPRMTSITVPGASFSPNNFKHENDQARSQTTSVPGRVTFMSISGTRLMDEDTTIQDWFAGMDGAIGIDTDSTIAAEAEQHLRDAEGNDVKKWSMTGVIPTSFAASGSLTARGGGVLMESFSLHFDNMTIE